MSLRLKACELSPYRKIELFLSSPYKVIDIKCSNSGNHFVYQIGRGVNSQEYKRKFILKVFEDSGLKVQSLSVGENDQFQWSVSNGENKNISSHSSLRSPASHGPEESKKGEAIHSLLLGLYSGISSIKSTDTVSNSTEKAASNMGLGFNVKWLHHWKDNLSYFIKGSVRQFKFNVNRSRSLKKSTISNFSISTGVKAGLGQRITLSSSIGIDESLILGSTGNSVLEIEKVSIPIVNMEARIDLVKFNSGFNLYSNIGVSALLPTNQNGIEAKLGHLKQLGIGSSINALGGQLNINSSYSQRNFKVGNADQTTKGLGFSIGVGWSF